MTDASAAEGVVVRFNDCINRREAHALAELMTEDHAFIDTEGAAVHGRTACVEVWRGFFDAFPDYRNTFASVTADGGVVTVAGRSDCSEPGLDGPALWRAVVRDGRVAQWRVYDDTAANRDELGLPPA